jgi:lipoprotein-releasing system permease protein
MFKPLSLYVGLRYTRAKRRNHFISFISLTSMLGITLGVSAMIIVLSVMNGFEKEMRTRILDMISHLNLTNYENRIPESPALLKKATQHPHVLAAASYIQAEGMLIHGTSVNGSVIRGVVPEEEARVSKVAERMEAGKLSDLKPGKYNIVLGYDLANILGVNVGDKITMVTPSVNVTPAGILPRLKRFTVSGIFNIGMYQYDSAMALIHLKDAQKLFRMPGMISGVQLELDDLFNAPKVAQELRTHGFEDYWVRDWSSYHSNWFRAVKIEKRMIFLLLLLIVAVAAFNIVSTLVMMVTDKESDIAILRTLGASPATIMRIFMVQGSLIGVIGTLLGGVVGVLAALNLEQVVSAVESILGFKVIDPSVYYISDLPSDLHWGDVWVICLAALSISLIATVYPARRASRTQPAEALRYE